MTTTRCSECKFAVARGGGSQLFDCHRMPPECGPGFEWPIVRTDDWCGEFIKVKVKPAEPTRLDRRVWDAEETILHEWNKIGGVVHFKNWSKPRSGKLRSRMSEKGWYENALLAIPKIQNIPFMLGVNDRSWKANIDFFLRPDTVTKICEGAYAEESTNISKASELLTVDQFFSS